MNFILGQFCLRPETHNSVIPQAVHPMLHPSPLPLVVQLQLVPARYSESVREVLSEIGEVVAVESVVRHLELGYMGRVDCISRYRSASCTPHHTTSHHITMYVYIQ